MKPREFTDAEAEAFLRYLIDSAPNVPRSRSFWEFIALFFAEEARKKVYASKLLNVVLADEELRKNLIKVLTSTNEGKKLLENYKK